MIPHGPILRISVTLPDSTTVTGEFSTPSTVDPTQSFQSLTLGNLVVKINGTTATVSGTPTAEFASGDLLGVTATATLSGTTVQIDDAIATDGGADAQIGYVAGSASSASTSGTGGGGSSALGFGMYTSGSGSISGIVWEDANGDGMMDDGESGNSGVSVELLETNGSVLDTTETDSYGDFSFGDLSDNQYVIAVETTEAFTQPGLGTTSTAGSVFDPGTGMTAVTIADGRAITGIDAGLYTPVSITGSIFVDAGDTGYFEAPDAVLSGDTITLENSSATPLATTNSADGSYSFSGLAPGTYQVAVGQPLGYDFTTENATDNPTVDSEVNASTGVSSTVTLADGASAATINAGLLAESGTGSISGTITTTATGTEAAATGVTVQLIDPATGTILQTATTDGSGDYSFSNLVAGDYAVTVQSNEYIASGGAFDTSTYTASESVSSGQSVTSVNAELTVPEQGTFTLDEYSCSISYSIPLTEVDPTQSSQSIALTDFSITIGSQTFYVGTTTFSTSPSIQFAYGQMTGISFDFDPFGAGLPYSYVSMSDSNTLSAYNTNTDMLETTAADIPRVTLNFSTNIPNGNNANKGELAGPYTITVKVTVQGLDPIVLKPIKDQQTNTTPAGTIAKTIFQQLDGTTGVTVTVDGGSVVISGTAGHKLLSVQCDVVSGMKGQNQGGSAIEAGGADGSLNYES